MPSAGPVVFEFGPYRLEPAERRLSREGAPLALTPRAFDTLSVLVARAGHLVTKDELLREVWGETFVEETTLAQNIFQLRKLLGPMPDGRPYIETVPKLGYRFVASVAATAAAEAESASAPEPARGAPRTGTSWRVRVALAALAGLLLSVLYFGWPRQPAHSNPTGGPLVLAVLPFENLTGVPAEDYLCDGLTEEVISRLARLDPERLAVIARTSSMSYRQSRKTVAEIGRELGAGLLLEGSVRREGDRLRVSAQLIRADSQTHVWSQDFDFQHSGLFALQSDVAAAVARQILPRVLTGAALAGRKGRAPAPEAYAAYLRARFHHAQGTVAGVERAIAAYEEAIARDAAFAPAHAGLARVYVFGTRLRPRDAFVLAAERARRAVELEPELPEGHLGLALVQLYGQRDFAAAEQSFRRAISLDPGSADVHFYFAHLLAASGQFEQALESAARAEALDPFSPLISHYVGRILYFQRRFDEAESKLKSTLELDPNYPWAHLFLATTYEEAGRLDDAVRHRQAYWSVMGVDPARASGLAAAYRRDGYPAVLREWARWIEGFARQSGFVTSSELALLYARLGERDRAFAWLDRAVEDQTRDLIYLRVEPALDPLRADPRFDERLRRAGFTADALPNAPVRSPRPASSAIIRGAESGNAPWE